MKNLVVRSVVAVALFASLGASATVETASATESVTSISIPSTSTSVGVLGK